MTIINLDTGILISSMGVITTIVLFILKTYFTKTEKTISQAEMVKAHESSIASLKTLIDVNVKELDLLKNNVVANRGRIDNIAEAYTALIKSSESVSQKSNESERCLVGVKRDIEYLKEADKNENRTIDEIRRKLDKLYDTMYNQYNRPYSRQKTKGRETEGTNFDPHEQRGDYDDVEG